MPDGRPQALGRRDLLGAHNPLGIIGGIGVGLVIAGLLDALLVSARPKPAAVVTP